MHFGIFDHLDRYDGSLADYYEDRLRLIEQYDRGGFYAYHVAEHHATPLGMAASPSIFLSAVAQRTKRLRFGPMVYALPLYHPLRILEEICMLDQLSGGRLEIGFGRGASPIELAYFGRDPEEAERLYQDARGYAAAHPFDIFLDIEAGLAQLDLDPPVADAVEIADTDSFSL